MQSGFKTYTDQGSLQLDSNVKTYALLKKTKVTCTGANDLFIGAWGVGVVTVNNPSPVFVAIKGTVSGQSMLVYSISRSGNQYTIKICSNPKREVEVYIYTFDNLVKASTGLNLYNQAGELTFSSATPYLKIENILYLNTTGSPTYTVERESDYYAISHPPNYWERGDYYDTINGYPYHWDLTKAYRVNSNGFSVLPRYPLKISTGPGLFYPTELVYGAHILVDVENTKNFDWS